MLLREYSRLENKDRRSACYTFMQKCFINAQILYSEERRYFLTTMYPRNSSIDLFSTFARLEDDRFRQWIVDPRLQRSMQQQLTNTAKPATDERVWAIYWHQQWLKHPLAPFHLTAYLQEPCFWVAQELTRRLSNPQYTLADYFQIANGEMPRVFKGFAADRGDRKSTRLNSSHVSQSRMPSSA